MMFQQLETPSLADCCEHQHDFHHCERRADAGTGSAAEREVGILVEPFGEFIGPASGPELLRMIKEARIALRDPLKHEYLRPGGYLITADLAVVDRFTSQTIRRGIKPHRFFRDLF